MFVIIKYKIQKKRVFYVMKPYNSYKIVTIILYNTKAVKKKNEAK